MMAHAVGTMIFVLVWPFVAFDIKCYPVGGLAVLQLCRWHVMLVHYHCVWDHLTG